MRSDEMAGDPQRDEHDPPRDLQLAALLRQYDASSPVRLDAAFEQRLLRTVETAMRERAPDRWYVALGRLSRLAVPTGLVAAAAVVVFMLQSRPQVSPIATPMMLSVASGAVSESDLAAWLRLSSQCESDVMCGAFGRVEME